MHADAHAALALALLVAARAVQSAAVAQVAPAPRDRLGYEREIDATRYNQVPKVIDYVLSDEYLAGAAHRNRGKLITRPRPDDAVVADNVVLESNVVRIVKPSRRREEPSQDAPVRRRRGYNLENVWVPARYPYLPYPHYTRYRRQG